MPRHREFDTTLALERAMELFWRQGYHDTSLDDLVEAMGVQRYGIYTVFKSKHDLYLAALDHYQQTVSASLVTPLETADASLPAIKEYFAQLVVFATSPVRNQGCLMCNTIAELVPHDTAAATKVAAWQQRSHAALRNALGNARAEGAIPATLDLDAAAHYLAGLAIGVSVYGKSSVDASAVVAYARLGLAVLV